MTESASELPANCRRRLDNYLDAIELALLSTDATRANRHAVIEMVEGQIIEMCRAKLGDAPSDESVQQMFANLDPAKMYAEGFDRRGDRAPETAAASRHTVKPKEPRCGLSRAALASVIVLALPMPLMLMAFATQDDAAAMLFSLSCLISAIGAPVLSLLALRQINASAGRLTGRRMALISLYLVPVCIANILLTGIGAAFGELTLLMCGAVTLALINAGVVWGLRRAINQLESSREANVRTQPEAPVVSSVASAT